MKRHIHIFSLHMQQMLQYRMQSLVYVLLNAVNVGIAILFWKAAEGIHTGSFSSYQSYYLLLLVISDLVVAYPEEGVGIYDIMGGKLSTYILRPYSYLVIKFQQEIVWRLWGSFWAVVILVGLSVWGLSPVISHESWVLITFVPVAVLAFAVSYLFKMCIGLLAFWMTSIHGILELVQIVMILGAGFMMPLSLLPTLLSQVFQILPFASMLYVPVALLQGNIGREELPLRIGLQVFWAVCFFVLYQYLWKKGIAHYTGVGQ